MLATATDATHWAGDGGLTQRIRYPPSHAYNFYFRFAFLGGGNQQLGGNLRRDLATRAALQHAPRIEAIHTGESHGRLEIRDGDVGRHAKKPCTISATVGCFQ